MFNLRYFNNHMYMSKVTARTWRTFLGIFNIIFTENCVIFIFCAGDLQNKASVNSAANAEHVCAFQTAVEQSCAANDRQELAV